MVKRLNSNPDILVSNLRCAHWAIKMHMQATVPSSWFCAKLKQVWKHLSSPEEFILINWSITYIGHNIAAYEVTLKNEHKIMLGYNMGTKINILFVCKGKKIDDKKYTFK